jgi:3-phosphoshikimate 1-carboxyvinyltransferase
VTVLNVQPGGPLLGEVSVPGDKSISHRAALFAALADGCSRIENFLVSGVTRAMTNALASLGVGLRLQGSTLHVYGQGLSGLFAPATALDCGNSATTLRLLAGALAAAGIPAVLDGSDGLRRRPMARILDPLRAMGVSIQASPDNTAPLVLPSRSSAAGLHGGEFRLPVASAQVKTCLLLAGLAASTPLSVLEPHLSRDHSERMLSSYGGPDERPAERWKRAVGSRDSARRRPLTAAAR